VFESQIKVATGNFQGHNPSGRPESPQTVAADKPSRAGAQLRTITDSICNGNLTVNSPVIFQVVGKVNQIRQHVQLNFSFDIFVIFRFGSLG